MQLALGAVHLVQNDGLVAEYAAVLVGGSLQVVLVVEIGEVELIEALGLPQAQGADIAAAEAYLAEAKFVHNRDSLFVRTEEGGETLEEIQEGVNYDYVEILTFGIHAKAVREAFDRLPAEEQYYLEKRNAICMMCGKAESLKKRLTFILPPYGSMRFLRGQSAPLLLQRSLHPAQPASAHCGYNKYTGFS